MIHIHLLTFIIYFFLQNARPTGQVCVLLAQVSPAPSAGLVPESLFDE